MTNHRKTLRGAFTAIITPFNEDNSIDYGALDALVDWQIEQGIQGLVPCGTTGESVTMTSHERADVITRVVTKVNGRVPVIAGAGSSCTAFAIEHQKRAADTGAQYALVATPAYNKPSPEGLFRHYEALSQAADIPIVLYNVPGRTACDMLPATIARLAKIPNIVAVKEATADLDRVGAIRSTTKEDFSILSGDDVTSMPFVHLGGDGVVSVTSNVAPADMVALIGAALEGRAEDARIVHHKLRPLFAALFLEANPIPVKAAAAMQKRAQEFYRLPLCEMSAAPREELASVMSAGGWQ